MFCAGQIVCVFECMKDRKNRPFERLAAVSKHWRRFSRQNLKSLSFGFSVTQLLLIRCGEVNWKSELKGTNPQHGRHKQTNQTKHPNITELRWRPDQWTSRVWNVLLQIYYSGFHTDGLIIPDFIINSLDVSFFGGDSVDPSLWVLSNSSRHSHVNGSAELRRSRNRKDSMSKTT